MIKLLEKHIEESILHWANLQPWLMVWKHDNKGTFDVGKNVFRSRKWHYRKGISDLIFVLKPFGRLVACEVKTESGLKEYIRQKKEHVINQKCFIDDIMSIGGSGFATCSLDHAMKTLKEIYRKETILWDKSLKTK